jgi:hypothetical protein
MELQKPEIECSICDNLVALETAKTDEVGQAVHEECYLLNLGIKRGQGLVRKRETNADR